MQGLWVIAEYDHVASIAPFVKMYGLDAFTETGKHASMSEIIMMRSWWKSATL